MAVDSSKINLLINTLHYPKLAIFNKVIAKDYFVKNNKVSSRLKSAFIQEVQQVNWVLSLNENNTKIAEYIGDDVAYREINLISVQLKSGTKYQLIAEFIFAALPKATLLELTWLDEKRGHITVWAVADYKRKLGTENSLIATKQHLSHEITFRDDDTSDNYFGFENQSNINLRMFYESLKLNIEKYNYFVYFGKQFEGQDVQKVNEKADSLRKQIGTLTKKAKAEKQLNKRMSLVSDIQRMKTELKQLEVGEFD